MDDPKIYLAVDNCFASKRWTEPAEWVDLAASSGVRFIEASADVECDPFYNGVDFIRELASRIEDACADRGAAISSFYSGHGSYATLGLAHPDRRVRARMLEQWLLPFARVAASVGTGFGFYCHAFRSETLASEELYASAERELVSSLARFAAECSSSGLRFLALEQMYSPHQVPWTIDGTERMLARVLEEGGAPLYVTIDTGHQSGQRRFMRPTPELLLRSLRAARRGEPGAVPWLGPAAALFDDAAASRRDEREVVADVLAAMDRAPSLFAKQEDGDPYEWLARLGCYSPIIHLQQTDGSTSSHVPFTEQHNARGIIGAGRVLEALRRAYQGAALPGLPPRCREIYLTIEYFPGKAEYERDIIRNVAESIRYWRRHVPTDGMRLSETQREE